MRGGDDTMLKAAFMFVSPDVESGKRVKIDTPTLSMMMVGAKDYDDAVNIAKNLVEEGIQLIELCGGYGPVGAAKIIEAVGDKIPVGLVSFGSESAGKLAALLKK